MGTPHIQFKGIRSDVQTKVGTLHKFQDVEKQGGHCTFKFGTSGRMFKLGWGHRTTFNGGRVGLEFEKQGGTPHIPIEDIWLDIQTRVGAPHTIGVGTPLNIERKTELGGWVRSGWSVSSCRK